MIWNVDRQLLKYNYCYIPRTLIVTYPELWSNFVYRHVQRLACAFKLNFLLTFVWILWADMWALLVFADQRLFFRTWKTWKVCWVPFKSQFRWTAQADNFMILFYLRGSCVPWNVHVCILGLFCSFLLWSISLNENPKTTVAERIINGDLNTVILRINHFVLKIFCKMMKIS